MFMLKGILKDAITSKVNKVFNEIGSKYDITAAKLIYVASAPFIFPGNTNYAVIGIEYTITDQHNKNRDNFYTILETKYTDVALAVYDGLSKELTDKDVFPNKNLSTLKVSEDHMYFPICVNLVE